jgi:hypothetical protein
MLNLSDKDLDRLSQEAAQQHEPGDIVGTRFWDKLEARLDRDLGKVNPNPASGVRRLPYYYAPALLVILGISYYLVRLNNKSHKGMSSGSPPLTLIKPAPADPLKPSTLSPNPVSSDKSNSTSAKPSNTVPYPGTAGASPNAPAAAARPGANPASPATNSPATSASATPPGASASANSPASPPRPNPSTFTSRNPSLTSTNSPNSISQRHHHHKPVGLTGNNSTDLSSATGATGGTTNPGTASTGTTNPGTASTGTTTPTRTPRDLTFSAVRGPVRLTHTGAIDDSALRAFTLSSIHRLVTRKGGLHINRSLLFGLTGAPDFASVNSTAGDRAGSTLGITVDYQFANHWYIGSGLLFSRKIFAAAPQNYHVPDSYYQTNGMWMGGAPTVDYIKGRFDMLEIPLDLRYDFNTSGSTIFFASVGTSSYLFTNENCNYYYNFYNRPVTKGYNYTSDPNNLFSTLNLSMGAEAGISNSLSLLIAPYFKIPTRNIGFGQVQLSSFGIDFALRFAPVLSRRR